MNLQKIYTALLTADLAVAETWYANLLGRGPDHRPMDTLVQWELFDQGGLMVSTSDEIAGRGVMFLYVDDVAAERRRLQGVGSCSGTTLRATTRRWLRCVILTATWSRWRRRPRGPFRRHDRAGRVKSASSNAMRTQRAIDHRLFCDNEFIPAPAYRIAGNRRFGGIWRTRHDSNV
jgi:hypothetical protein